MPPLALAPQSQRPPAFHFPLNESAIISARSRKGAEFSGTWLLDPHNLWVYNSSKPAKEELPSDASKTGDKYTPEADIKDSGIKVCITENSSGGTTNSYVSDKFINEKLVSQDVWLMANGNITLTNNTTIKSSSTKSFVIFVAKITGTVDGTSNEPNSGHLKINNTSIDVQSSLTIRAAGNITINDSSLYSKSMLAVSSTEKGGFLKSANSNFAGTVTSLQASSGSVEVKGGNVNGTNSVRITTCTTDGNATLSGVSVNAPDFNVTGSNITIDNTSLNISPRRASQGISIGLAPSSPRGSPAAQTVVIKNSTLNTTGSTAGVIKVQEIKEHSSFLSQPSSACALLCISTLNESFIISARSRKGAEFSGTWLLDPHNLWVYNSSKPATDELPGPAGAGGKYTPEANSTTESVLKISENRTATDSYITDGFVNEKLKSMAVQLTASGNLTVTSNVSICSTSSYKGIVKYRYVA